MLDSVLKSLNTKQKHSSVPEEPRTFAGHQENLKKHIFIKFKAETGLLQNSTVSYSTTQRTEGS